MYEEKILERQESMEDDCKNCPDKNNCFNQCTRDYFISNIIFWHGKNDYELWDGFNLTDEEENTIMEILNKHINEGYSVRGSLRDIIRELEQ